ncbi:MAG: hypothetical protein RR764_09795 [Oscillospiraceae bacterium]
MKKYIFATMLLCSLVCLSACTAAADSASLAAAPPKSESNRVDISSSNASPGGIPESATTPTTEAPNLEQPETFINSDLLTLVGTKSSEVKKLYNKKCYARITGMGGAELLYYEPYISFLFMPSADVGSFDSEGVFEASPFSDDLSVMRISLQADFNKEMTTIANQDSLRAIFNTREQITYDLLCKKLGQEPALSYDKNVIYTPIVAFSPNEASDTTYTEGEYRAVFTANGVSLEVAFIPQDNQYVAARATLQKQK